MGDYEQGLADGRVGASLAILDHLANWATTPPKTAAARVWDNALRTAARVAVNGTPPGPQGG